MKPFGQKKTFCVSLMSLEQPCPTQMAY